jgi:hypothetical protein
MMGERNMTTDFQQTHGNWQNGSNGNGDIMERRTRGVANRREMSRCRRKRAEASVHIKTPLPGAVITERADPSPVTNGWVNDTPCLRIVNIRPYVTVAHRRQMA